MARKTRNMKPQKRSDVKIGDVTIKSVEHLRKETAIKHDPEFKTVKFGDIEMWEENPRIITPEQLELLARSIKKYGMFKTLTCWPGKKGKYITGGGNMRYRAMKEVLSYSDDTPVRICLVTPRTYAEKIELSFLDNQSFGFYSTLEVADLIIPYAKELDMEMLTVQVESPLSLSKIVDDIDEAEDAAPLTAEAEYRDDGRSYVPIGGDLAIVGFGNYCGVLDRTVIDKMAAILSARFGDSRVQRTAAGEWIAKFLGKILTEEVGPPTPATHMAGDKFTENWENLKATRKVEKEKEYEQWKKEQLNKNP